MATIYNKTALKKVKKDELIQMFLDLQAQRINDSMDEAVEKCCTNAIEEVVENLKKENMKLKEENERLEARVEMYAQHNKKLNRDMEESEKYDWKKKYHHLNTRFIALENIEKKLKDELHKNTCDKYWSIEQAEMRLGDVIEKLKEENEKLKAQIKP